MNEVRYFSVFIGGTRLGIRAANRIVRDNLVTFVNQEGEPTAQFAVGEGLVAGWAENPPPEAPKAAQEKQG